METDCIKKDVIIRQFKRTRLMSSSLYCIIINHYIHSQWKSYDFNYITRVSSVKAEYLRTRTQDSRRYTWSVSHYFRCFVATAENSIVIHTCSIRVVNLITYIVYYGFVLMSYVHTMHLVHYFSSAISLVVLISVSTRIPQTWHTHETLHVCTSVDGVIQNLFTLPTVSFSTYVNIFMVLIAVIHVYTTIVVVWYFV